MSKKQMGVRFSEEVAEELKYFCSSRGMLITRFVEDAVREKLREAKETEEDLSTIEKRKFEATLTEAEWKKLLQSKGIDV